MAIEYPVTAADGRQTRIDLVLCDRGSGMHLCIECKRAHPDYKKWVFFGQKPSAGQYGHDSLFVEIASIKQRPVSKHEDIVYRIAEVVVGFPCFNYYLEAKIERDKRVSSTERIEDAFSQVMFGQTGLMRKLFGFQELSQFAVIPVVVTSASLYSAEFKDSKIDEATGIIDSNDLKLSPREYLAVNYHASDNLALDPELGYVPFTKKNIEQDLVKWQMRTIFVVQAKALPDFLRWAGDQLTLRFPWNV